MPQFHWTTDLLRRFVKLYREGRSDTEIARLVRAGDPHTVSFLRRKAGLPSNAHSDLVNRRVAANTRKQLRLAGAQCLQDIQARYWKEYARSLGWPEDLRHRAVQMLEVLWQRGPQTRRQIAEQLAMPWHGARKSLVSADPKGTYLSTLMERGLVICLRRKLKTGGPCQNVSLYMLAAHVTPSESRTKQLDLPLKGKWRCPSTRTAS